MSFFVTVFMAIWIVVSLVLFLVGCLEEIKKAVICGFFGFIISPAWMWFFIMIGFLKM